MEDPFLPIIDLNGYSVEQDLEAMLDGVELALKIFESKPFKDAGAEIIPDVVPQCNSLEFGTRDYWKCQILYLGAASHHMHSTCRMGYGKDDKDACVDSKLRVIGVERLRVIDLSVIPEINANPMAPVMLVAEKGASMILKEWDQVKKL